MSTDKKVIPINDGLWTILSDGEAKLLGSRCTCCGELFFPRRTNRPCIHCQQRKSEDVEFGPLGTLVSFTNVLQPPAGGFYQGPVPYCFGLVDLDDGVRIEAHVTGDVEELKKGMRVKLAIVTLYEDSDGNKVQTFCFRRVERQIAERGAT